MDTGVQLKPTLVRDLFDRVKRMAYTHYLLEMKLGKARAFRDQTIRFEFPVTAIIGPNGGGKSTILAAAACLYRCFTPGDFFVRSALDDSMLGLQISYKAVDRSLAAKDPIVSRTASYRSKKWRREALTRPGLFLPVRRIVPASERSELNKYRSRSIVSQGESFQKPLDPDVARYCSRILGKDVSSFRSIVIKGTKASLLVGSNGNNEFSEFHFGAGESNVITMVQKIENTNENSLILIEEIENTLHPLAVQYLVEYLVEAANRKRLQIIFTTHSQYAIQMLPPEAIWAAIDGKLTQGHLDIQSLRAIGGDIRAQLAIFVEDKVSKLWLETIIKYGDSELANLVEIHAAGGYQRAIQFATNNNMNPASTKNSIVFVDADAPTEQKDGLIYKLPGEGSPEQVIVRDIIGNLHSHLGLITANLQYPFDRQQEVKDAIVWAYNSVTDFHSIFLEISRRLVYTPEETVCRALITAWCDLKRDVVESICGQIRQSLDCVSFGLAGQKNLTKSGSVG